MTELDGFERRLVRAFDALADEMAVEVDAGALASAVMKPRRTAVGAWLVPPSPIARPAVRWAAIALLVLAAMLLVVVGSGILGPDRSIFDAEASPLPSRTRSVPDQSVDPGRPIPVELDGGWDQPGPRGSSALVLDFQAHALVVRWDGSSLPELGRVVAYDPLGPLRGQVTIGAPDPCGTGAYEVVRSHESESGHQTLRLSVVVDPCEERLAILEAVAWRSRWEVGEENQALVPGRSYDSGPFGEPFHYVARDIDPAWGNPHAWSITPRGDLVLDSRPSGWTIRFVDDAEVFADPCATALGTAEDIPISPEAVRAWLSASGVMVGEPRTLTVDGRVALRFEVHTDQRCGQANCQACLRPSYVVGISNYAVEPIRLIYAIPTGDDTILVLGSSDGSAQPLLQNADGLVASLTFDQ